MRRRVLPGFGLTVGLTTGYLGLVVLLPLAALVLKASTLNWHAFWTELGGSEVRAAFGLSFGAAACAAAINGVFGLVVAWVLVRYPFPGRRLINGLVDLPFALPTSAAGIALTAVYARSGWVGGPLAAAGLHTAFSRLGVVIALTFIGLPFMVRTVEPVLRQLDAELEEAAATLGAGRWDTVRRVLLPPLGPAALTGFTLALARALGEYGSVVFISGNLPGRTEIVPVLIMTRLGQFDYAGASALAVAMLAASFALLVTINALQARVARSVR